MCGTSVSLRCAESGALALEEALDTRPHKRSFWFNDPPGPRLAATTRASAGLSIPQSLTMEPTEDDGIAAFREHSFRTSCPKPARKPNVNVSIEDLSRRLKTPETRQLLPVRPANPVKPPQKLQSQSLKVTGLRLRGDKTALSSASASRAQYHVRLRLGEQRARSLTNHVIVTTDRVTTGATRSGSKLRGGGSGPEHRRDSAWSWTWDSRGEEFLFELDAEPNLESRAGSEARYGARVSGSGRSRTGDQDNVASESGSELEVQTRSKGTGRSRDEPLEVTVYRVCETVTTQVG